MRSLPQIRDTSKSRADPIGTFEGLSAVSSSDGLLTGRCLGRVRLISSGRCTHAPVCLGHGESLRYAQHSILRNKVAKDFAGNGKAEPNRS
jgi:hypothetical protein